ncbi:MAG: hypothetical protein ACJAUP_002942 [Cellvibrionaceae bacterium]|jgi:hypothetical protein
MTIHLTATQVLHILSQINGNIVLALVAISILLSLALLLSFRQTRKLAKQLNRVQHDLKVSSSSMINIGQQLLNLEKRVNQTTLSESVNRTVRAPNKMNNMDYNVPQGVRENDFKTPDTLKDNSLLDNADSIYDKARYYLAKGDSVESIAKRCNLSHAEVSLLKALSKKPAESF